MNDLRLQYLTVEQKQKLKDMGERLFKEFDVLEEIFHEVKAVYDTKSERWIDEHGGDSMLLISLNQLATEFAMLQQNIDGLINTN